MKSHRVYKKLHMRNKVCYIRNIRHISEEKSISGWSEIKYDDNSDKIFCSGSGKYEFYKSSSAVVCGIAGCQQAGKTSGRRTWFSFI